MSAAGTVAAAAAIHALTIGIVAGLIIGMITRTALGRRPAGASETWMYVLMRAGAVARVLASLDVPLSGDLLLLAAAVCWTGAFCLYLFVYAPYLLKPRLDGKKDRIHSDCRNHCNILLSTRHLFRLVTIGIWRAGAHVIKSACSISPPDSTFVLYGVYHAYARRLCAQ